jgi:hypothetical protein
MLLRLSTVLVAAALAMTACSSGSGVPDDQVIKPAESPAGWTTTKLDTVTLATPAGWTKDETKKATDTLSSTTWRAPLVDGVAPGGVEVREISKPQQKAEKAARALALNAMATLDGGKIEPKAITWPGATDDGAYYLSYEATTGTPDAKSTFVTRTLVLDVEDGSQIQVTSLMKKGTDKTVPEKVLSTVTLPEKKS